MHEKEIFTAIFADLALKGKMVRPRDQLVIECENYSYRLSPFTRFQNFKSRKLNVDYIKSEMLWYLKGDRYDLSIADRAKIWKDIINSDGTINSNYGQYVFNGEDNQFDNVIKILSADKDSRRGSIMILRDDHLLSDTRDVPCTYGIGFRIRDDKLNMTVHMRSQDAIFGMANDCPAFSFIHEMMLNSLRKTYPRLQYGEYFHFADSFHVYERHFSLLEQLSGIELSTRNPIPGWQPDSYEDVDCPHISGYDEVTFLRKLDFSKIPQEFKFCRWLNGSQTV